MTLCAVYVFEFFGFNWRLVGSYLIDENRAASRIFLGILSKILFLHGSRGPDREACGKVGWTRQEWGWGPDGGGQGVTMGQLGARWWADGAVGDVRLG